MNATEFRAWERVAEDERLAQYIDIILCDWSNWDEYIAWLNTAPVEEIVDLAARIHAEQNRSADELRQMVREQYSAQTTTLAEYRALGRSDAAYIGDLAAYIREEARREGVVYSGWEWDVIIRELEQLTEAEAEAV